MGTKQKKETTNRGKAWPTPIHAKFDTTTKQLKYRYFDKVGRLDTL